MTKRVVIACCTPSSGECDGVQNERKHVVPLDSAVATAVSAVVPALSPAAALRGESPSTDVNLKRLVGGDICGAPYECARASNPTMSIAPS